MFIRSLSNVIRKLRGRVEDRPGNIRGADKHADPLVEEVYFKLANANKGREFFKALLSHRIPHTSYYGNIFATSIADKSRLEGLGFKFEMATLVNLGNLSLRERNGLKDESRRHCLATRDQAISELIARYGQETSRTCH
jgi:hypothetical protein